MDDITSDDDDDINVKGNNYVLTTEVLRMRFRFQLVIEDDVHYARTKLALFLVNTYFEM